MNTARWYDLPDCPELDQPVPDVLGEMRARTDAAIARLDALNDRANCLYAGILLGLADEGDVMEFERSARAFRHEVAIDREACDAWLDSHSAADYLPTAEA